MKGELQWHCDHCGTLRLGGAYGEDYTWAATAVRVSATHVAIHGLVGTMSQAYWDAGAAILTQYGFTHVVFDRLKKGKLIPRIHRLKST